MYKNTCMFIHLYVYGCAEASAFVNRNPVLRCEIYMNPYMFIYINLYQYMYKHILMFVYLYVYGCAESSAFVNRNPVRRCVLYTCTYMFIYIYTYICTVMFVHLYVYGCEGASAFVNTNPKSRSVVSCSKVWNSYEYIHVHIYIYIPISVQLCLYFCRSPGKPVWWTLVRGTRFSSKGREGKALYPR